MIAGLPASLRENWAQTLRPDKNVADPLRDALWVAAGAPGDPLVRQLLTWCVEYADLADHDPRWESGWNSGYRDQMRGNLIECRALARAWLADSALDDAALAEAAALLENNAIEIGFWAGPEQSQLLAASQLYLIAGDAARARAALARRKRYRHTQHYLDWYVRVLDLLDAGDHAAALGAFDEWFDVVRRADWTPPSGGPPGWFVAGDRTRLQLRLALIRRVRIERQPLAGHWREVIATIAGP